MNWQPKINLMMLMLDQNEAKYSRYIPYLFSLDCDV
jgi:hypothetical protein